MARSGATDPLEKFRFIVAFSSTGDGTETSTVGAGFHDVQLPKRATNKIAYREGTYADGSNYSAGLSTFEDITLSRGLIPKTAGSFDGTSGDDGFYDWVSSVTEPGQIGGSSPGRTARATTDASNLYRKTVTITMYDRAGVEARRWELAQAWPVNYVPGSDLDASEDGEKSIESVTLAYEDFKELTLT